MKVKWNNASSEKFNSIPAGSCFIANGDASSVYLKIEEVTTDFGVDMNAVNIIDGNPMNFSSYDEIQVVNCTLIID